MAKTRRNKKGSKILDVRSDGAVKLFEKALVKGPLTLVYVNAKWCGACHRFNDEVWSQLTKLKNRSVNLASVDSEYIGKTSLANVPRKFYPTLMLVGKDKKPATFEDEEGQPTNAMPRNATLEEDREALSNLVVNPTMKANMNSPPLPNVAVNSLQRMNSPLRASVTMNSLLPKAMNSPPRANITKNSLAKSPFEAMDTPVFSNEKTNSPATVKAMGNSNTKMNSKRIMPSNPPDIGADLIASQKQASPLPIQGGGLLNAIKGKTAQLKSMIQMRKHLTRRNRK
jgi:hypothetical protein